jgi:hypothetical protein
MRKISAKKYFSLAIVMTALPLTACGQSSAQSIEDIRSSFIEAGGKCDSETISVPTTSPTSSDSTWSAVSKESISCGEDQATIYRYDSTESATKAAYFVDSLKFGLLMSFGTEAEESFSLVKDNFSITIGYKTFGSSEVNSIAEKMGATVVSATDQSSRKAVFDEYIKTDMADILRSTAEGCMSSKQLSSDGKSISFDTKGNDDSTGDLVGSAFCVLRALMAPDYIFTSIQNTRALDGLLEENWDVFKSSWRYHPDDGLQMTIISTD